MRTMTGVICASLLALLAGCATTAPPPRVERISPEELERIMPKPVPDLTLDEIVQMSKAGTPAPDIIAKINKAMHEILAEPELKKKLLDLGIDTRASTPQAMNAQMEGDIKKWAGVIEKAGIPKH